MAFAKGENVGPYRIVARLGQGGVATVYKAYHPALDRHVAIKVLHEAFREDPDFSERFRREAQIVARLEHSNIVPIYDFNEHKADPYLVMKFIEGETLKARLLRRALRLDEGLHVLSGVGEALAYAHERGVLHRDIKPSNIMIDTEETPYVTDFGLARITAAGASTLSQDMILGTPQYISPEQARGDKDLDAGTDIYSLGVVLYELVVGQVPFNADTPYAIIHDHIFSPLPLPRVVNPSVPPAVEMVLLKVLAKGRADRYETAADLVTAFREAVRESEPKAAFPTVIDVPAPAPAVTDKAQAPLVETPPSFPAAPPPPPFEPAIPPVVDTSGPAPAAPLPIRKRHGNLWLMSGVGGFVLICLLGTVGVFGAFSTAIPGSGPVPTLAPATPELLRLGDFVVPSDPDELQLMLEEAQRNVDAHSQDAAAQFDLALLTLLAYPDRRGWVVLNPFVQAAASDPALLLAGARSLRGHELYMEAASLYLRAMALYWGDAVVRDEAGAYLWQLSGNAELAALLVYRELAERLDNPTANLVYARALISTGGSWSLEEAHRRVMLALDEDGALAEAHLTLGLVYIEQQNAEAALDELQFATTAPNSPDWVQAEARRLIYEYDLRSD
jgi:serine/threonine protein kinase